MSQCRIRIEAAKEHSLGSLHQLLRNYRDYRGYRDHRDSPSNARLRRPSTPFQIASATALTPDRLMLQKAHIRIARSTNQLEKVVGFYTKILGFQELGSFAGHAGFDGVMMGFPGLGYHLEFTQCHQIHDVSRPSDDDLLVFYVPEADQWQAIINHIEGHDIEAVTPFNPYWAVHGRTYEDPDGFRIVIQHSNWQ